jgi:hypothetical protein
MTPATLYELSIHSILKSHQGLEELLQYERILPEIIFKDFIRLHKKKCVEFLICFVIKDEKRLCRDCFNKNPTEDSIHNISIFYEPCQIGSNIIGNKYKCSECKGDCIEQTSIPQCFCVVKDSYEFIQWKKKNLINVNLQSN